MKKNIVVREVDEEAYREFRAEVVRQNRKNGEALTEAIQAWTKQQRGGS